MAAASSISTGYGPSARTRLYFDGKQESYPIWETRFTNFLFTVDKGVHKALLPPVDGVGDDADFNAKNRWAYAELVQVLDERSLQMIMSDASNDGRKALQILRSHYASTEKPRVLTLYEQLTTLRMLADESITDYIIRAERAAVGLRTAGETITDNLIIAMMLKGLPEQFKPFVVVHTQLDKTKTVVEFKAALQLYANTEAAHSPLEHTAMTAQKSVKSQCLSCGKHGHNSKSCRNKTKLHCSYCDKPGHTESVCFKKKREGIKSQTTSSNHASASFSFKVSENGHVGVHGNCLLVDCGATSHIVNSADVFVSYDKSFEPKHHFIELADGRRSNNIAIARGDAKFCIVDTHGIQHDITLRNSLLAPEFPTSLFSVRAATDSGAKVIFSKGEAKLIANDTQFNIVKHGQLYFLHTGTPTSACTTRTLVEWHRTLGHMNCDDILRLQSVSNGMTVTNAHQKGICATCAENKMTKMPKMHDEIAFRANYPLQRVHTDICGPIDPISRDGYRYIINFVDEHSGMLFVYFLRSKDEAHVALKNFLADIAPFGKPKEIHSDNGGEYTNKLFKNVLHDECIKQTFTAPYSPYQNGKSERSWRSLMEMTRCLIADADIPKYLWPYAVRHAQYLRNRSFQRKSEMTAYELLTGTKPDMRHIHPFGATCTVYIEGQKQKLGARGQKGLYLGINPKSQGYFVLNQNNGNITTSRNVRVHDLCCDEDIVHCKVPSADVNTEIQPAESQKAESDCTVTEPLAKSKPVTEDGVEQPATSSRPSREVKTPKYLDDYYCTANVDYAYHVIPETYDEAINSDDAMHWNAAMDAEMKMLIDNDTWELTPLPADRSEVKGK
jgi:hypothetical protein